MPESCGYSWSAGLDLIIREESARLFVPLDLAYTFVAAESGFNPNAHNITSLEDSVGLLQLNRIGGQGQGYTVQQLLDPRFNLQVGLPFIARAYAAVWSDSIQPYEFLYQVAVRSGHPGAVDRGDPRIVRIFSLWACFHSGAGQIGPGGSPAAAFAPGPGQSLAATVTALFAPGMPIPPASLIAAHAGSVHIVLLRAVLGSTARFLVGRFGPRTVLRRQLRALSPVGLRSRLLYAINPRAQLASRLKLPIQLAHIRLPPGHRFPRH